MNAKPPHRAGVVVSFSRNREWNQAKRCSKANQNRESDGTREVAGERTIAPGRAWNQFQCIVSINDSETWRAGWLRRIKESRRSPGTKVVGRAEEKPGSLEHFERPALGGSDTEEGPRTDGMGPSVLSAGEHLNLSFDGFL